MKVGDKLYRIVEEGYGDYGYEFQVRTVKAVTAKTFSLDRPFSFCFASHGTVRHDKVGSVMFTSAAEAVANFARKAELSASDARSKLGEAERMIAWAAGQGTHRDNAARLALSAQAGEDVHNAERVRQGLEPVNTRAKESGNG